MLISIHDKNLKRVAFLDNEKPSTLHYFNDTWHRYLTEATSTFDFSVPKTGHKDLVFLTDKGYVSFSHNNVNYLFNVMKIEETEKKLTCYCENLNLELLNETSPEYKAPGERTFAQYINLLGIQYAQLEIGINEMSDLSRTLEWEGQDTKLARLLSLVTKFDAECEFVTHLNRDGTLDKIVLNVYRKHDESYQGVGTRRKDVRLYYGKEIKEIRRTVDKTGLYTAIKPIGTDGLTISSLDKTEYDTEGKVLFRSAAGDTHILCPPMREEYPSQVVDPTGDRYINLDWTYETKNVNTLYGQALAKLKSIYIPAITYEVDGFFDLDIGDTVKIHDNGFTPLLLLEARVSEQEISFSKPDTNKTTFANFRALENRLSSGIQSRLEALIQQSVPYTADIITTEGIVFKNGEGSTKLTARVARGTNIVTSQLKIQWYKDGAALSTNETITVNAADVTGKAVYRFEATDSAGDIKCFAEVTVVDVSDGENGEDGKAQYLHVKYSDDGGQTFTANQGETPGKWMGYYVDFESADSNNPDNYTWVKVEGPTGADGKDGTNGTPATAYSMLVSAYAIVKSANGAYTPSTITLTCQAQTGENPLVSYAGRFRIQETTDMETWTTKYTSSANEAEKTYTPSAGIKAISCSMYLAGGTTTLLDRQIIPIVSDGKDGEDGTDGNDGAAGKGISNTAITYQASSSGTTVPTGTWTTTIPTVAANQYLWTRTVITYTDNSTSTAYSIGKVGANGSKGDKGDTGDTGITGPKGADGKTYYTWLKYADTPTTGMSDSPDGKEYIGLAYNKESSAESSNYNDYTWSLIKGDKGDTGVAGAKGADGQTTYTWVKYGTSSAGAGMSDSPDGKTYIGLAYNKTTATESTNPADYSWSLIKGDKGATGADGKGVKSTAVTYQASTSGTTVPTGTWLSSIPSVAANQYLWTRTVITYTDDTTSTSYSIGKMGANGTDGADGADAYTIVLSNESHTFVGGTSAALAGSTICKVLAYKGGTQIAATIGTISGLPTGMTASITNNSTVNAQFTITVTTAMATTSGMLTIPITVDGKSFTKNFSFALALKGSTGSTGPQGDPMGILELATEPPTKYVGMLWKHTGTVSGLIKNAVYRWSGSAWVLFKFKAENIEATSLSAISADLGTVNAGTINGVTINGVIIRGSSNVDVTVPITSGDYSGGTVNNRMNYFGFSTKVDYQGVTKGLTEITPGNITVSGANRSFVQMNTAIDTINTLVNSLFSQVVASGRVTVTSTSKTWLAIATVPNYSSSNKYFVLANCLTEPITAYVRSSDGKVTAYGPTILSGSSYTVDYVVIRK